VTEKKLNYRRWNFREYETLL